MAPHGTSQDVLARPARSALFLVLTVRPGSEAATRDVLADLAGLRRSIGFRYPDDHLSVVAGIGALLWDRMYGEPRPAELHPFREVVGRTHTAVSTPGDVLLHLRAARPDLCFELARQILAQLSGHVDVVDETHAWRYLDERDLLGFVDGTENPEGPDAAAAVLVDEDDAAFAGGSYVLVQKYLHDMEAWEALSVEEQEAAFGRHKLSDIEFADEDKASDSHLTLNTIVDPDGTEREVLRDNRAFGSLESGEYGTYFIAYASTPDVPERMLRNMFIGVPEGNHDRILDFSTAITGGLFFAPTVDFLEDPTVPTTHPTDAPDHSEPGDSSSSAHDGSLGIGSLKDSGF